MLEIQNLQNIVIKSFFSSKIQEDLKRNPEKLLEDHGICKSLKCYLPDVTSQAFQVESYGRKFLVSREIERRFKLFIKNYLKIEGLPEFTNSQLFQEFLESSFFYEKRWAFPHYTGIGAGYENSSKFFIFIINKLRNNKECDALKELWISFAHHLHNLANFSDIDFYKNFKNGVFFKWNNQTFFVVSKKMITIKKIDNSKVPYLNTIVDEILDGQNE